MKRKQDMSMIYCHTCNVTIDTDNDLDHHRVHEDECKFNGQCEGEMASAPYPCDCPSANDLPEDMT